MIVSSEEEINFFINNLSDKNCSNNKLVKKVFYKFQINSVLALIRKQLLTRGKAGHQPHYYFTEVEFNGCKEFYIKQLIDGSSPPNWGKPNAYEEIYFNILRLKKVERQPSSPGMVRGYRLDIVAAEAEEDADYYPILVKYEKYEERPGFFTDMLMKKLFPLYKLGVVNPFAGEKKRYHKKKFTIHVARQKDTQKDKDLALLFARRFKFVKKACDYIHSEINE